MFVAIFAASSMVFTMGMLATNFIIMRRVQHIDTSMKGAVKGWLRKLADSMDDDHDGKEERNGR